MSISYPKDQRERAAAKGVPLVTIDVDDRHLKHGGRVTYQGQIDGHSLAVVVKYFIDMAKKHGVSLEPLPAPGSDGEGGR